MKISLNWLREYIDLDFSEEKISELLTDLGLEVEGVEHFESIKGGLRGVIIGEVVECAKHPNADKLSLTKVDIGESEFLQIVCGAPNVAAGQKVVVATVGTTLYSENEESWTINKGKIRGEVSEGMICAEDELGLGKDHSGIMVLPENTAVGIPASEYFEVTTDTIFEIGLTPNRSDGTNHIGVAKDLAAVLRVNYNLDAKVNVPSVDSFKVDNHDLEIKVSVENTDACPRYSGISIKGLEIGESPAWLKDKLNAIGLRPINNVVDATNFILYEFGQPLHAFDIREIQGKEIIVKTLDAGTKFLCLDEIERELTKNDLMICDGKSQAMCIGGVFGGLNSGVKDDTVDIFLESAHFNPTYIRRSKTHHKLLTDAAGIFEKGSDPNITVYALKRAAMLIKELAGGEIASDIVDIYPEPIRPAEVSVKYKHVNRLIGTDFSKEEIFDILHAMEMETKEIDATAFMVKVPTNKYDVTREADIIEEILRVYGLNKVEISNQIHSAIVLSDYPELQDVRNQIADLLFASGFNEIMGLSMVESKYFEQIFPHDESSIIRINNTSNVHLDVMRPNMLIGGLEAVLRNQNRQQADIRFFEFGKTYRRLDDKIVEREKLVVFISGKRYPENWHNTSNKEVDYFSLKHYVEKVLLRLGVDTFQRTALEDDAFFQFGLKLHRGQQDLVNFGKVKSSILKKMDIKNDVYYAEFSWDNLFKIFRKHKIAFKALNKFPGTRRDLALVVEKSVKFEAIEKIAQKVGKKILKEVNLFDVFEDEVKVGKDKKSYAVSFTFEDPLKTLKDKEIDKVISQLISEFENKLNALIRR